MGKLFGTDGVRGIANRDLSPQLAFDIARAAAYVLSNNKKGRVIIGKDTRLSGDLIESSLASGLLSFGIDVDLVGVVPTPAIAYLTRKRDYIFGIEISASHNPYNYNGIKIFSHDGYKLPDEVENKIEELILSDTKLFVDNAADQIGTINRDESLKNDYINYLKSLTDENFNGVKIAVDAGNGALSKIAKDVLEDLGAEVFAINTEPNGKNINDNCGSTNPTLIKDLVKETKADLGMSFDGDADRIIAVDENANIVDGDHILAIIATYLKKNEKLKNNTAVGTVMSNMGLKKYFESIDINFIASKVGDRYILEDMKKGDFVVGAEQSGHVIMLENNTTGDGLATGIVLLDILKKSKEKLSRLSSVMTDYPQVLVNVKVRNELKNRFLEFKEIAEAIYELENKYDSKGRVLIRPSGTEPLVRVMIEGLDKNMIETDAKNLAEIIEKNLV